jgi:hypothetical protein
MFVVGALSLDLNSAPPLSLTVTDMQFKDVEPAVK